MKLEAGRTVEVPLARFVSVLCTTVLLAACSGDGGSAPIVITTVSVSAPLTTVTVGESAQLTATARDASGAVVPAGTIAWSTSAAVVATVNPSGLVSAIAPGQTTITATAGGVAGSLLITVTPRPSASATVSMPAETFTPFTTAIIVGGMVHLDFPALPHNVIFDRVTGAPADILATSNRTVSRTFPAAGTFPYNCTLHPGMSGVVVVR